MCMCHLTVECDWLGPKYRPQRRVELNMKWIRAGRALPLTDLGGSTAAAHKALISPPSWVQRWWWTALRRTRLALWRWRAQTKLFLLSEPWIAFSFKCNSEFPYIDLGWEAADYCSNNTIIICEIENEITFLFNIYLIFLFYEKSGCTSLPFSCMCTHMHMWSESLP